MFIAALLFNTINNVLYCGGVKSWRQLLRVDAIGTDWPDCKNGFRPRLYLSICGMPDIWDYITLPTHIVSVEPMQILHEYDICLRILLNFN